MRFMLTFRPALLAAILIASLASGQETKGSLTDQRIMELALAGVSETELILIVATAPKVDFDLRPISTDALLQYGVSEEVIKAMSARQVGKPVPVPATLRPGPAIAAVPQRPPQ